MGRERRLMSEGSEMGDEDFFGVWDFNMGKTRGEKQEREKLMGFTRENNPGSRLKEANRLRWKLIFDFEGTQLRLTLRESWSGEKKKIVGIRPCTDTPRARA